MAFKDILLHLDNSPGCPARIGLAINLARAHGAHLRGMYVISHSFTAHRQGAEESEAAKKVEAMFAEMTAQSGISAEWLYVDWPVVNVSTTEIINQYAYYTDLVIAGQPDHSTQGFITPLDLPERVGLGAGRPLLIVPYVGTYSTTGERVMIAWKPGRESSRVVNDAMPLLEKAGHVSVITISAIGARDDTAEREALNLCSYLSRHQINATHEQIYAPSSFPVGDMLLNHACEQKIDLLVMGAFAPTRRGVFVFGPVAKHLMSHMTVPVLISH